MTQKHIKARRERNEKLGKREAQARCAFKGCQLPLSAQKRAAGLRFCDSTCEDAEYFDRERRWRLR